MSAAQVKVCPDAGDVLSRLTAADSMNVLLTCAGRRGYLVEYFQQALLGRGQVIACDCSDEAPALVSGDQRFLVPPMAQSDYFDVLLSICREQRVRLLFSVNDQELAGLAEQAPRFRDAGTILVVASPAVIALCHDKWATFRFLKDCGVPTPETYVSVAEAEQALAEGAITFPLIIKPRWGTSSMGIHRIDDARELALAYEWGLVELRRSIVGRASEADFAHSLIIQQCLSGTEYGMDVVNDLKGRYVCTLARRKLAMRFGNTDRAATVSDPRLERLSQVISLHLKHVGGLDCDVFEDSERGLQVLDLNPRLGGGYPFSHLAGANLPAAFIAWANDQEPDPSWLKARTGVFSSKYDGVMIVDEKNN